MTDEIVEQARKENPLTYSIVTTQQIRLLVEQEIAKAEKEFKEKLQPLCLQKMLLDELEKHLEEQNK